VIRWIHISDLNLRSGSSYRSDLGLSRLIDFFDITAHTEEPLNFIFCTGDIASSGKAEEYEIAREFFFRLSEVTRVPPENILTIPGNHDIERSRIARFLRLDLTDRESSDQFFSSEEDLAIAFRAIQNYCDFEHRVFGRLWNPGSPYLSIQSEAAGLKVAILGFNTSWVSQFNSPQEAQVVGHQLVARTIADAKKAEPDIIFVLMHHPLEWLVPYEREPIRKVLARNVDFVLNGHFHAADGSLHTEGYSCTVAPEGTITLVVHF
jgi:hypothetical protein